MLTEHLNQCMMRGEGLKAEVLRRSDRKLSVKRRVKCLGERVAQ